MNSKKFFPLAVLLVFCFGVHVTEASAVPMPLTKCGNISTSGSYILTKNIVAAGDCFTVQVNNVTLNLDGYTITGNGTGRGIWDGDVARLNIAVRNGRITNFEDGIRFIVSSRITVERMQVTDNTGVGVFGGPQATIKDNVLAGNGNGIIAGVNGLVTGNNVSNSDRTGIIAGNGSTISGNIANNNGPPGSGFAGISANPGSTVSNNTASNNGGFGIFVECPANLVGNTALGNDLNNINEAGPGGCTRYNNNPAP